MSDRSIANSLPSLSPTVATSPAAARPVAARTKLLLEGPIFATLVRLATPNALQLLAIAGMITFDGLFLGRLGPDALAGVSLAFPFMMLMQHAANSGMGGGASSAIARALGAGSRDRADALVCHAFHSGACARCVVLNHDAAWRSVRVSVDGWRGRSAVRRTLLFERSVQRRGIHLRAECARQRCAWDRQYGLCPPASLSAA